MKIRHYRDVVGHWHVAVDGPAGTVLVTRSSPWDTYHVWFSDQLKDIGNYRDRGAAIRLAIVKASKK